MSLSSWLWGTTQTDEAIDKATSELLPAGAEDMALNLEICDQIRSKAVPPKDAMKALKRRMNHRNPNVQLLTLGLTDVCIKNGGDHFLVEIASREFMDNLVSILKMPTLNHEVKTKMLRLIQNWAVAFEGKPALGYVGQVYKTLKNEGFAFPPQDLTASSTAMVDTSTAPEWIDSDVCLRCRTAFSFTNRKHHCRNCGQVFDQACSSKMLPLPHFGITQEVRVCDGCYVKLTKNKKEKTHSHDSTKHRTRSPTRHKSARELADAELQRAIELSLAESGGFASGSTVHHRPGYVPAQPNPSTYTWQTSEPPLVDRSTRPAPKVNGYRKTEEEEDDPELKAAIEASLKEANAPKPNAPVLETPTAEVPMYMYNPLPNSSLPPRTSSLPVTSSSSSSPLPSLPAAPQMQPAYDLSPYESSAILEFSQTVEAAETSGGRDLSRYAGVSEMYDKAQGLRPKLVLALGDAERKEQMLADMHDKLSQVVKLYDKALTEQVSRPWRSQAAHPSANTPQQQHAQWAPQQATPYGPQQPQYAQQQPQQQFVQQLPTQQQQQYAPPQASAQVPESQYQQPQMTGQQQSHQWQPQAQQQGQFAPPVQQQFASPSSPPVPAPISQYNHPPVGMQSPPPPQAILSPAPPQQVQFAPQNAAPQVQSPPPQQIQYATAAQILAPAPQTVQSPPAPQFATPSQGQIQGLPPPPQALQSPALVPEAGAYPWQSMSPTPQSTLSRNNTVSYGGSQSAAPSSPTLTRHNTVTYGQAPTPASAHVVQPQVYQQQPQQQQQQHYQSPAPMPSLPQFPVAPTSNPQAFSLYGPAAGGVEQTERKEALLIDL
ncbi:ubiquitin binding protein [Rickenella mellea]|uniref:Vacuolar protein sorting-associated protein 27 n=1 Tax=Rickenella mellea TaxID=50990 RepID=A0A4Y7Q3Z0_9AGAM|nr:ubiquitin binding protein [Rickenella mellea]